MSTYKPHGEPHSNGRIPPHNLEAESSLLGAALLNTQAAETLNNTTAVRDFYRPVNQHIAQAIRTLANHQTPIDPVTVANELQRTGLLIAVGGIPYLAELQMATPAVSAAPHYARIVREASTLRDLIYTGSEISDLGYSAPDDTSTAVARAQQLIESLNLAPSGAWQIFANIEDVLAGDQTPPEATILRRKDGTGLIYPGRENTLQGEPASGKSWVAFIAAAEILGDGGTVAFVDFEDTPLSAIERLRLLGVHPDTLIGHFLHTDARDNLTGHELTVTELGPIVAAANPDLVVLDSVSEAFSRWHLDENEASDVNSFRETFTKPLTRAGSTVVSLDHVAKSLEQRGRYARGSGAKLSGIDGAAYSVTSTGFNRHTEGRIYLKVAKDRHGSLPGVVGETVAQVWMHPTQINGDELLRHIVEAPPADQPSPDKTAQRTAADNQLHDELRATTLVIIAAAKAPLSRRRLLSEIRVQRRKDHLPGFTDQKIDPVLTDLENSRAIAVVTIRGHDAWSLPPTQQSLLDDSEQTTDDSESSPL